MYCEQVQVHVTVLHGLPAICKASIAPPDRSVGIFQSQLDDYELFWPSGHEWSDAMYDRLDTDEIERLQEEVFLALAQRERTL